MRTGRVELLHVTPVILAVAVTLLLLSLLFALFTKTQPIEVAGEAKREHSHSINESVSQQRSNKVYHSPVLLLYYYRILRQTAARWQAFSLSPNNRKSRFGVSGPLDYGSGDPNGNRTHAAAVKGRCPNR